LISLNGDSALSNTESTLLNQVTIFPNPASTLININFNNITELAGGSINVINSLGQQVANVSKFDERDLPRLKQVDSYFFEGVATIEDDYLVYKNMDGSPHGSMPMNKVR
jgi:hypothetical protein